MAKIKRLLRQWRRARAAAVVDTGPGPLQCTVLAAACRPDAPEQSPPITTRFQANDVYSGMEDVEIRGFLDGQVKFRRNVATQYHVRIGCEGSKPHAGRYEVMRVLERWDVLGIPAYATILSVKLRLEQEDTSAFPHIHQPLWPVDVYAHELRKPWGGGRGGARGDNESEPEPGDAWWLEAQAGKTPWAVPGAGLGDDVDPAADRSTSSLAAGRLEGPEQPLVLEGAGLVRLVQQAVSGRRPLCILLKLSDHQEHLPGSVRAFYSREFGDDHGPEGRPALEVVWTAPCVRWIAETRRLEPGRRAAIALDLASLGEEPVTLALHAEASGDAPPFAPRVCVHGSGSRAANLPPVTPSGAPWSAVLEVKPSDVTMLEVSAEGTRVLAGAAFSASILETWAPDVAQRADLLLRFHFLAPSGRSVEARATYAGDFRYRCELLPEEVGLWRYTWETRPDGRFLPQRGGGAFTVAVPSVPEGDDALARFVDSALQASCQAVSLVHRRSSYARLTSLARAISVQRAAATSGGGEEATARLARLDVLQERVGKGILELRV